MESKYVATRVDPLHICHRRKFDWFGCKKNNECSPDRRRLALGDRLYIDRYNSLAIDGNNSQHSFWPVQVLY